MINTIMMLWMPMMSSCSRMSRLTLGGAHATPMYHTNRVSCPACSATRLRVDLYNEHRSFDGLIFRFLIFPASGEIRIEDFTDAIDLSPWTEVMNLPEPRYHEARGVQIVAVRFQRKTSVEEVVARLLETVRRTELTLLKVFGDGDRVYPFEGRHLAWSGSASSWRVELSWHSPTIMSLRRSRLSLQRAPEARARGLYGGSALGDRRRGAWSLLTSSQ